MPKLKCVTLDPDLWCTRAEARDYLHFKRASTVDARLTESPNPVPGKIRFRKLGYEIRLHKGDVLKLLPPFRD